MKTVTLARNAMATRFELVLHGNNATALRAAGEEAMDEIERLESQLSLYRPSSEIAQINARAARERVHATPEVFALLQHAQKLSQETGGAFDITVAPLVRCWGFMGSGGKHPSDEELVAARAVVGMNLVQLNPQELSVRFAREGVMLDLGAIGKGYAVERAANLLREAGVTSALIHGGTSTVCAIGSPPEADFWKVGVEIPKKESGCARQSAANPNSSLPQEVSRRLTTAATIPLKNEGLSVSAVWGRSFEAEGKTFGHVLDPRTGQPVRDSLLAAAVLPSATESDALSTALLTLGVAGFEVISRLRSDIRTLLVTNEGGELRAESQGIDA